MNAAVFFKTLRDARVSLIFAAVGVVVFEMAMVRMLVEAANDLELLRVWLERPLVKTLIRLTLGADLAGDINTTALGTFGLVHPILFAISWALLLSIASGVIAGEIGRGTADLLLTLPVSRLAIYLSTSLVWLLAAGVVSFAPIVGLWLGDMLVTLPERLPLHRLALVQVNLLALNLAVAGVTMMMSSVMNRRGVAVAAVLSVVLASDLIGLLAQFWPVMRPFAFLGFLYYYRPLPIVRTGTVPLEHLTPLLGLAAAAWVIGLWRFTRRDIPAA